MKITCLISAKEIILYLFIQGGKTVYKKNITEDVNLNPTVTEGTHFM
jgi:hypothetical protein